MYTCVRTNGGKKQYIYSHVTGRKTKWFEQSIARMNKTYTCVCGTRKKKKKTKKLNGTGKTETKRNKKTKKLKRKTENETADGDYAGERSGNGRVGWRSVRSAGNCGSRRTSERQYSKHRTRQEADARLQWWSANGTTAYAWSTLSFFFFS